MTVNGRIPRDIEISLFICNNLQLNHTSFGLDEIAGNKRLQCIQERIKNTILCDIHGIPLKRPMYLVKKVSRTLNSTL